MKYRMKLRDEDRKIAVSVFKTAFYQQAKKMSIKILKFQIAKYFLAISLILFYN